MGFGFYLNSCYAWGDLKNSKIKQGLKIASKSLLLLLLAVGGDNFIIF